MGILGKREEKGKKKGNIESGSRIWGYLFSLIVFIKILKPVNVFK